eukprot:392348_1
MSQIASRIMPETPPRKRRIVYNSYVDIDCVTEDAGPNCANWIQITKLKLQERESKLLNIIKEKIESIVNETLDSAQPEQRNIPSFTVSDDIMTVTSSVLLDDISEWQGINLARLKHPPTSYRHYYTVSKKSWDRRKTKLFGSTLWVNLFKQIHKFTTRDMRLTMQILQALFCGTIKYNNTRPQSLISGMIISHSAQLKEYLHTLDESFRVNEWITQQKTSDAKALQQKMQSHFVIVLELEHVAHVTITNELQSESVTNNGCQYVPEYLSSQQLPTPPTPPQQPQMFAAAGHGAPGGYCAMRGPSTPPRRYDRGPLSFHPRHMNGSTNTQYPHDGGNLHRVNSCGHCRQPYCYCCNCSLNGVNRMTNYSCPVNGNAFGGDDDMEQEPWPVFDMDFFPLLTPSIASDDRLFFDEYSPTCI